MISIGNHLSSDAEVIEIREKCRFPVYFGDPGAFYPALFRARLTESATMDARRTA